MKKTYVIIGVILAVLVAAAVYLMMFHQTATAPTDSDTQTQTESSTTKSSNSSETESEDADTITYSDEGFSPAELTVKEGTEITVKNESSRTLDFASNDHPTHLTNSELNIGLIEPGASKTFIPSQGEWGYHDHLNANATGKIIVE